MSIDYEQAFKHKERELALVLALDQVRDSIDDDSDPQSMFDEVVRLLRAQFGAAACAMALCSETSDDIETTAFVGFAPDEVEPLCRVAMNRPDPAPIASEQWLYTIGIQVILRQYPLAGLVLARQTEPFSRDEVALLQVAEKQLDSAVIQARTIWKLVQRNRELEAIYELDRLRDSMKKEMDLIAGFTSILLEHFGADLCLLLLSEQGSGEMLLRGVVDEHNLPPGAINTIRANAAQIQIPQVIPTPDGFPDLRLLAAPFLVAGSRLGAVVVGRSARFTVGDHRLLYAMMSQMDSALAVSRARQRGEE